jgi:hypothetical protein
MQLKTLTTMLLAASAALTLPAPAQTQAGLTLAQVEARYPRMSTVHIEKCNRDGDNIYTRTEMLCVQSIYQAMYIDN